MSDDRGETLAGQNPASVPLTLGNARQRPSRTDGLLAEMYRNRWAYVFLAVPVLVLTVFWLGPIIYSFVLAFLRYRPQGSEWVGLANFRATLSDYRFGLGLRNTLVYTVGVVGLGLVLSLGMSAMIFRLKSTKLQVFFKAAYYLPSVASAAVMSLVWLWLYEPAFGLLNYILTRVGLQPVLWLANPRTALPSLMLMSLAGGQGASVVLLTAAMGSVPPELYEAASIDGASEKRQFFSVTLPLVVPTILYLVIMGTINGFQVFTNVYMMTNGGPGNATTTVVYNIYRWAFDSFNFGRASAEAVFLFLILVVVSYAQYRGLGREVEY
ncbi:MAG: sugar ABC transporter permease [Anaerolineae bacterium]|nr:sugar ABC transporter permease [Anaerolineae bacterium]